MIIQQANILLGAVLFTGLLTLGACSKDNDEGANTDSMPNTGTVAVESPAGISARAVINNGYYLAREESFDGQGLSLGGVTYMLNAAQRQIDGSDFDNETSIDSVYRYDEKGELSSVSFLSSEGFLAPMGDEIQITTLERENDALQAVSVDYLVGNEMDYRTTFTYNETGQPVGSVTRYTDLSKTEDQQYNYEDGILISLTGTDIELPGVTVTNTITRDTQGRISVVETSYEPQGALVTERAVYSYDANENVSGISYQGSDGTVQYREVFTYEATDEVVFNLNNYLIYFDQK